MILEFMGEKRGPVKTLPTSIVDCLVGEGFIDKLYRKQWQLPSQLTGPVGLPKDSGGRVKYKRVAL